MLLKRTIFLIPALLLMFASTANAHGPVRGKMTASVIIDAPAEKVWDVVKDYGDLSWLPLIKNTKADKGNKKGSVRVLTLKDGGTITEELKAYKPDKMSYKYKITDMSSVKTIKHSGQDEEVPVLPVENYAATINVNEKAGKTEVKWVATYYRAYVNNNPPEEMNEEAADKAVTAVLKSGLTNLLQKFDKDGKESAIKFKMKR
ncbi:MAG: SRPBCC family protein [Methylococcales bacterium]|nr:SRPBCC family protein [Methylococcales bacterium]